MLVFFCAKGVGNLRKLRVKYGNVGNEIQTKMLHISYI